LLARLSARAVPSVGSIALLGVVLIGAGGVAKALWKVLLTAADRDIAVLQQSLFPLLATGFVLVAWALWSGLVGRPVPWWPAALALALGIVAALAKLAMSPLLIVAASAALITSGLAIRWAVRDKVPAAVVLFVIGMASSIVLAYLAGPKIEQTLSLQWVEEITNTVGQGAFLLASLLLWRGSPHAGTSVIRAADPADSAVDA